MNHRPFCLGCRRAQKVCQCADVRRFEADPVFVILMHPVERRMKTGTGRLAHLCVSNSILIEGANFANHPRVSELISDPRYFPVLLHAGAEATSLQNLDLPKDRRLLIFIIDTKWSMVKTVLNQSPNLKALPKVCLVPSRPSGFHTRRQPKPNYLSSIEAIHHVVEQLSPGRPEHAVLLEVFDKMVERQLGFQSHPTHRHRFAKPRKTL
ncbi:MAG TPA: tRNA-uridine aminocarboxypropyltransferase [Oligoflexia bacterium]|nr:tRNA-uridine aminocarboxypropyltransferase [Oligoflexia bacterium]